MSQKAVIDMVVIDMPYLKHLELQVANPGGFPNLRWGFEIEWGICDWIPTYEPPASCQYLPRLSVAGRRFVGIRNRDTKLAYG
jgi:hypothetical protein